MKYLKEGDPLLKGQALTIIATTSESLQENFEIYANEILNLIF